MKYEYMVLTWGGFYNKEHQAKHGLKEGYYWFDTKEERDAFKGARKLIEIKLGATVLCFSEREGFDTRTKYVAHMDFIHEGVRFSHSRDHGYTSDPSTIEYMYHEGNYSCDCNRSLIISRIQGKELEFEDAKCGDSIKMENFRIETIQGTTESFDGCRDGM